MSSLSTEDPFDYDEVYDEGFDDGYEQGTDDNDPSTTWADESDSDSSSVYYENCDAARADGAAPVYYDDPGYGSHLDRDGDGIGCE